MQKKWAEALLTKANFWEYENEYRLIKNNCAKKYEKINFDEITAIYFGLNSTKDNINLLKDISKNRKIKYFKCVHDNNEFKINFKEI